MITIVKNVEIYAPESLGLKQVVLIGDKIEGIYDNITIPENFVKINVIEGEGKYLFPGFIDAHVHLLGGGGEGGFSTRTPEIQLSNIIVGGTTTVVGCLGTDSVCRDMKALIAKAYALEEEGITTYVYTGSYEIPVKSVTESIKSDIMLINKIIGVGEVALSDHRSSQPSYEEFLRLTSQARVAGLLSGKAGIVHVHMGDGERRLEFLYRMLEDTEIPIKQIVPTHINRSIDLFKSGVEYAKRGGYLDLTTSSDPEHLEENEVKASKALKMLLEEGIPIEQIMFSSDGQGSLPRFDEKRQMVGLGIGEVRSLYREVKDAVQKDGVKLETALKTITSNVADALKLSNKGRIGPGKDADLVLVNKEDLSIYTVIAKGKEVVFGDRVLVKGTFEN
ncbi:beta-aspartyl-peptidase [Desnuesiella massiliensis]|uniref:beta-aspartyl-peptidase n=1 Tax=Desnuesiella massiliensis TaxID=1650662 RepID=UPI0006E1E0A4|nr:beta-aspartyl-peptidase [Desnuesiella massiliensis]